MGRDLTNLYIDETYDYLLQISGSEVQNGLGVRQDFLDVSASYALTASFALNAGGADTGSLLVTASAADATITFTKGDGSTFDVTVNNTQVSQYSDNTIVYGKNLSGGEILKGTPLYFTGSGTEGNLVGVYPADASNPLRMPAAGIAGETMADEAEGAVLLDGFINGVNTTGFTSGQEVYVGVGGGYTATRPTGSNVLVQTLGYIEKVSDTNGSGVIKGPGHHWDLPNIEQGRVWVGSTGDVPTSVETGSLSVFYAVSASYATSASYEIVKEVSSSYADYAKEAGYATSSLSSSYAVTASHALNAGTWDGQYTGDAGITGSLTVIGESTVDLTQQDLNSVFTVQKGDSSYTFGINQFPGFTGSILSANSVDEFKVTGDTSIALDNTGYAGTNQVALRSSDNISLVSATGVSSDNNVTITGQTQNTLRLGTTGSSDYVTISGPTSAPYTFDGSYIQGITTHRTPNGYTYLSTNDNSDLDLFASGSATTAIELNVNGDRITEVVNNPSTNTKGLIVDGNLFRLNLENTGSNAFFIDYFDTPDSRAQVLFGVSGYRDGLGNWLTTTAFNFAAADQSFMQSEGEFIIKNIYEGTGSIRIDSHNELVLAAETGAVLAGGDPYGASEPTQPIDIRGKAFANTIASNINGFSNIISVNSNVRPNVRAFVETPMQVGSGVTVTVETGATLKVINEL